MMLKNTTFWIIIFSLNILLLELIASSVLIYLHRSDRYSLEDEVSKSSLINSLVEVGKKMGVVALSNTASIQYRKITEPEGFNVSDSLLGYASRPGEYIRTYQRKKRSDDDWESLKIKVTINPDGSRWTGNQVEESANKPTIYLFGDSFVFGIGVNDEHTFGYLLQQALPNYRIKLFALGGYSLTQAYLKFTDLQISTSKNDIIILGYGDYYGPRHVLSPTHLSAKRRWFALNNPEFLDRAVLLPKIDFKNNDEFEVSYVNENCALNDGYCQQPEPSPETISKSSAALINYFSQESNAKVFMLHVRGEKTDPVFSLIDRNISVISATEADFDSFVRDDIEGFDKHPGPYWHHAVSRKILSRIGHTN